MIDDFIKRYLDNNERNVEIFISPKIHKGGLYMGPWGLIKVTPVSFVPRTHIVWFSEIKIKRIKI
jgi:hypothetical protein